MSFLNIYANDDIYNNNNNFIHNKIPILVYNEYITLNKKILNHMQNR